ncbi:alkaline phosphatase family protein [Brachybacterium hainanense]|uniref:Alkaline phosphatase family protein n=1 Tax=Brachybacterium hainanense TaxID=1541174 RepID=A0ABV6R617_9MICO
MPETPAAGPLLLISVDAMHTSDIPFARTLPAFSRILERAAIAEVEGIYPSVTYPNHTAQITGCGPATSGVYNNLRFQPGKGDASDWFAEASAIRVPTLLDAAGAAGLVTASVQWPVTVGAESVRWLVPELAGARYGQGDLAAHFRASTDPASLERYVLPNLPLVAEGRPGRFFDFVGEVAAQILERERPDLLLVHYVEVDTARHAHGAEGVHVEQALREVDAHLGRLLAALEDTGRAETADIVLVSDHGHLDVEQHTNLNAVFAERGFLRRDEEGNLADYDVICLGAGLSGQLFLAEDLTAERYAQVAEMLAQLEADPELRIERIWTSEETRRGYGLDGPFSFVVESEPGVVVGHALDRRPVVRAGDEDFPALRGAHGHAPRHGGQPVLIASGPSFQEGVDLGRRSMLDIAPTLARVLGVELPDAEGAVLTEVLAPQPAATA